MGGGGQQQGGSGTSNSRVSIPPYLQGLKGWEQNALKQMMSAQGGLPSISDLYGQIPQQGVAPLTDAQLGTISQYEGLNSGPNASESTALGTLSDYATRPISQDPAVQAAQQQWGSIGGPQQAQQNALSGTANSGAAQEAQAIGARATELPAIQGAESQQLGAANSLFGAGNALNTQQLNTMAAQLQAEGIPQQEAQQIANSLFQQQQQKFQYASGVQQQPLGLLPSLLGSKSVNLQTGSSSMGK